MNELLKKILAFIAAILGIGSVAYLATGAWAIPQNSLYASMITDTSWYHLGTAIPIVWEVHPNSTNTITSASYYGGACSRNSSDFLLWSCGSATATGTPTTVSITVSMSDNSTQTYNSTFTTRNITAIPGCEGLRFCTVSGSRTATNATHMFITVPAGASLTLQNGSVISAYSFSVNGGTVVLPPAGTAYFSNIGIFSNSGSVSGVSSSLVFNNTEFITNTGTIVLSGADGTQASACLCDIGCVPSKCTINGGGTAGVAGTNSGSITIVNSTAVFNNTGTIYMKGGKGGDGSPAGCGTCISCRIAQRPPAPGGNAGSITATGIFQFINSGTLNADPGAGGAGWGAPYCENRVAGSGSSNTLSVYNTTTITNTMSALTGSWTINTCAVGAGNNYALVTPSATVSSYSCLSLPTAPTVVFPISTSNFTNLLNNISVNYTSGDSAFEIWLSSDGGGNWNRLEPSENLSSKTNYSSKNYSIETHRLAAGGTWIARVRAYNATSGLFSLFTSSANFTVSKIPSKVGATSSPTGLVSNNQVTFFCNFTNSTGGPIYGATAYLTLDGVPYEMTFNNSSGGYFYSNTNAWYSGIHIGTCTMSKADYASASNSTNVSLDNFEIFFAGTQTNVSLNCPFPTIYSMTPRGQRAGIGIFRIKNSNSTALKNYTLMTNNTLPTGIFVYARSDRFVSGTSRTGWTLLAPDRAYLALTNVNSSNSTAYVWLVMDCINAVPGTYAPFNYIFSEA